MRKSSQSSLQNYSKNSPSMSSVSEDEEWMEVRIRISCVPQDKKEYRTASAAIHVKQGDEVLYKDVDLVDSGTDTNSHSASYDALAWASSWLKKNADREPVCVYLIDEVIVDQMNGPIRINNDRNRGLAKDFWENVESCKCTDIMVCEEDTLMEKLHDRSNELASSKAR